MPESACNLFCEKCNFKCSKYSNYKTHLLTAKHLNRTSRTESSPNNAVSEFVCECGKKYTARNSLWYHKRVCKYTADAHTDDDAASQQPPQFDAMLVIELLKQNQEFKELLAEQTKHMIEQQQQLIEAVKDGKIGNSTNCHNTTNNNNKFNLNVFLNETCKDAISMDDFINSIEVTRDEFIHTGQVGFIEGISTVMAHRFRNMDMHTRPLHCTDLKRETIYIKNADKWEKDDADKTKMRKAVRGVAKKNMKELWRWYSDNKPAVEQIGTDVCEDYFKFHKAALGGYGKEEDLKFEDKIMHNVLKEVQVDKSTSLTV